MGPDFESGDLNRPQNFVPQILELDIDREPADMLAVSKLNSRTILSVLLTVLSLATLANGQGPSISPPANRQPDSDRSGLHRLVARVVDSESGQPIECRVHLRGQDGRWYLVESDGGDAVHYDRNLPHLPDSPEVHTTLSADPFFVDLANGQYTLRIERGKEYVPYQADLRIEGKSIVQEVRLRRWINMAKRGWYSGDTHVHRSIADLPNVMLAEDLNVAFPLTYWVRESGTIPTSSDDSVQRDVDGLTQVDSTHIICGLNTEYEIFTVNGRQQTLGAVLVLNHQSRLDRAVPPTGPVKHLSHRQGALLDLDKHSWPWSLMIVPIMEVDLFELSNNHVWQTKFGFPSWTIDTIAPYMQLQQNGDGLTEWGWIDYGLQTYYDLINCGFRMRVTAGTAAGVHPVQLGFGRVYVRQPDGFSFQHWVEGLDAGHSFVTAGPMLDLRFNGGDAGNQFQVDKPCDASVHITGTAESRRPLSRIEVIINGVVAKTVEPQNRETVRGGYTTEIDVEVQRNTSFWTAVRCFEEHPQQRVRFAHTNPVYVDLEGSQVYPRKAAVEHFIRRLDQEIDRLRGVIDQESLDEYVQAREIYQKIRQRAR